MMHRIIPAIMSGGAGARLWPLSTEARPKQFHALGGSRSLFAETVRRTQGQHGSISFLAPMVLCNENHRQLVEEDLAAIGVSAAAVVLEPEARNTAMVAAASAAIAGAIDAEALVLLLPSDHLIKDRGAFLDAVARASPHAYERIVTFGVTPTRPATEYGYIKRGASLADQVFAIESFREKPNAETARLYLSQGGFSWNAGMFLFAPQILLEEFAAAPEIRDAALASVKNAKRSGVEIRLDRTAFARAPSEPFDIAVMEKTKRAAVAPCDIGWADIGSWDEIWRLSERDGNDNAIFGDAAALDGGGNLLYGEGVKLCVAGIEGLIVVATPEAVLVAPRNRAQDIKLLRALAQKKS